MALGEKAQDGVAACSRPGIRVKFETNSVFYLEFLEFSVIFLFFLLFFFFPSHTRQEFSANSAQFLRIETRYIDF